MNGIVRIWDGSEFTKAHNVMTTLGKEYIASVLAAQSAYGGEYIGIGTGATAETAADTGLEAPVGSRVQGIFSSASNKYTLEVVYPPGNPATEEGLREAGLFSAATGGIMIARTTFPIVTKQTTDSIRLQWEITIN